MELEAFFSRISSLSPDVASLSMRGLSLKSLPRRRSDTAWRFSTQFYSEDISHSLNTFLLSEINLPVMLSLLQLTV